MVKLTVSKAKAYERLQQVEHKTFADALSKRKRWQVSANDEVKAQSVCWLFCWANTTRISRAACKEVQWIFDEILDIPYDDFKKKAPLEDAGAKRYESGDMEGWLCRQLR